MTFISFPVVHISSCDTTVFFSPPYYAWAHESRWKYPQIKWRVSFKKRKCCLVSWVLSLTLKSVLGPELKDIYFLKMGIWWNWGQSPICTASVPVYPTGNLATGDGTCENCRPGLTPQTALTQVNAWNQTNYCFLHIQHHCWSMKETPTLVLPFSPSFPSPSTHTQRCEKGSRSNESSEWWWFFRSLCTAIYLPPQHWQRTRPGLSSL